jgi:hypothetical protein
MQDITQLGSNWNNDVNASDFYWNLNNSSANSNRNIGTHLFLAILLVIKHFNLASWQKITDRNICVSSIVERSSFLHETKE